jgi:hypothetical protein
LRTPDLHIGIIISPRNTAKKVSGFLLFANLLKVTIFEISFSGSSNRADPTEAQSGADARVVELPGKTFVDEKEKLIFVINSLIKRLMILFTFLFIISQLF